MKSQAPMKSPAQTGIFQPVHQMICPGLLLLSSIIGAAIVGADDQLLARSATLENLSQEALAHSPLIIALRRHWEGETRMPVQEGTLPDPQITFQNLAVGNPIPGTNCRPIISLISAMAFRRTFLFPEN